MKVIILVGALLVVNCVCAQTSTLPLVLSSSVQSYPTLNVATQTPGNVDFNLVQLSSQDLTFNNANINIRGGSIEADDILFGSAGNNVNITATSLEAHGTLTFPSSSVTLARLEMEALRLVFSNASVSITVGGEVKIRCRELNLGTGTINVFQDATGGSLIIEYKVIHGTGTIRPNANVTVRLIQK